MGERLRRCRLETPICLQTYLAIGSQDTNANPAACELLGVLRPANILVTGFGRPPPIPHYEYQASGRLPQIGIGVIRIWYAI